MNPLMNNEKLLQKIQQQQAVNGGIKGQFDVNSESIEPNSVEVSVNQTPIDWNNVKASHENNEFFTTPIEEKIASNQDAESLISQPIRRSVKEQIEEVEAKLGGSSKSIADVTAKAKSFLDEYGDETFYVDNQSNGHIVISDLDITVQRSKCKDLLKFATLEDLKKSRDLRAMLTNTGLRSMLKRLTSEEYLAKKQHELSNKKTVEQLKTQYTQIAQQNQQNQQNFQIPNKAPQQITSRINPTILSKLEKLRLSTVPENAHLGLTPPEFIDWVLSENLSSEELDFVASHPNVVHNNEIRTAVYQKKSQIE